MQRIPLDKDFLKNNKIGFAKYRFAEVCTNCGSTSKVGGRWISKSFQLAYGTYPDTKYIEIPFCRSCLNVIEGTRNDIGCVITVSSIVISWVFLGFTIESLFLLFSRETPLRGDIVIWLIALVPAVIVGFRLGKKVLELFGWGPEEDPIKAPIRARMHKLEEYVQLEAGRESKVEDTFLGVKAQVGYSLVVNNDEWAERLIAGSRQGNRLKRQREGISVIWKA